MTGSLQSQAAARAEVKVLFLLQKQHTGRILSGVLMQFGNIFND
jgi:hypothetical protein